jgi:predicted RND superfamily exporter protein
VPVNYNLVDYLPKDAQSTTAIDIMKGEFGEALPNARVMTRHVTVREALSYKEKLKAVEGVTSVTWLVDVVGLDALSSTPLQFLDAEAVGRYYRDETALFTVTVAGGREEDAVAAIRALIGDKNAVAGDAVNTATPRGCPQRRCSGPWRSSSPLFSQSC